MALTSVMPICIHAATFKFLPQMRFAVRANPQMPRTPTHQTADAVNVTARKHRRAHVVIVSC